MLVSIGLLCSAAISVIDIMTLYVCLIYHTAIRLVSTAAGYISLRILCHHVAYLVYDKATVSVMLLCLYLLLMFDILLLFVTLLCYGAYICY